MKQTNFTPNQERNNRMATRQQSTKNLVMEKALFHLLKYSLRDCLFDLGIPGAVKQFVRE